MSDLPNADPQAARETAIKHLFRHLDDERELARNPLVGPDLRSGKTTLKELRARVAHGATLIREEDERLGRPVRGSRQAACLTSCDLGSVSVASMAAEFGISSRQLARERREAWARALPYMLPQVVHFTPSTVHDVVMNRASALFRAGRQREAVPMLREHIARSAPEVAGFVSCALALLQYAANRNRDARETHRELRSRLARSGGHDLGSRLELALSLLDVLVDDAAATRVWNARAADLARRAALEMPRAPWITLTTLRIFFALSQKFVCANDYKNLQGVCVAIEELAPSIDELDCHDSLSLHALQAINECKQNGFTASMEAHMLRVLHLAVANGWTGVVAEGASLLSSVYYLGGAIVTARDYRDMALAAVSLTDDRGSIALTHANLATAALDAGCVAAAAQFIDLRGAAHRDERPLLEHVPLVVAEVLIAQGKAPEGTARARQVLAQAREASNARLVAIAGRVVALGLDAAGERRAAASAIAESLDLAGSGCCSKYDLERIERSHRRFARTHAGRDVKEVTYRQFCN